MLLSIGDILTKALLNTVLGMGTVFAVLVLISLIISLFAFIPKIQATFAKKNEDTVQAKPAPKKGPQLPEEEPVEEDEIDEFELIAVITAAIAASTGMSEDGFVVRSIRRSGANMWTSKRH